MDAFTLAAAALVALFWAVVSVFAPFLPKLQPPPPAAGTSSKRRKRPHSHGTSPDLAATTLPTAQVQAPSATSVAILPETSSESSSLFSTAPGSLVSDNDTNTTEPLTPAPSEELVTPSSCSSSRPYRKFSEFKTAFTAPFTKKRAATLDLNAVAPVKPRRDRSRSSSRSRASFAAIFGGSRSLVSSPASEDIPLTPDSISSPVTSIAPPEKASGKTKRSRASLPLNLPPLSRLHGRRVSAPVADHRTFDPLQASTSESQSAKSSPAEDRAQLPPDASAASTSERGRDRGRRTLWKRAFSKRNDDDIIIVQHDQHEKLQNSEKHIHRPRGRSSHPAPGGLAIDTDVERRVRFSEEAPPRAPVRSQTWLEHREARAHPNRTRARSVDPKPDRHAVSARIAQEAWGRPLTPTPAPVAPT